MKKSILVGEDFLDLEEIYDLLPNPVIVVDRNGKHILVNKALTELNHIPKEELLQKKVSDISKESGNNIIEDFNLFDAKKGVPNHELSAHDRIFVAAVRAIRNKDGFAFAEIITLTDITAKKELEMRLQEANKKLQHLAEYDALTELYNVRTYTEKVDQAFQYMKNQDQAFAIIFLDVDHFKTINDHYGHRVGDVVLKKLSAIMKSIKEDKMVLGRVGGEEFSVFLYETTQADAYRVAESIRTQLESVQFEVEMHQFRVTISAGIAIGSFLHHKYHEINNKADEAMYQAKTSGRNRTKVIVHNQSNNL